jgi:Fe-S cluster assembly protein SufD
VTLLSPAVPAGVSRASLDALLALGLDDADARRAAFTRYEALPAPAPPSHAWKHDLRKLDLAHITFGPPNVSSVSATPTPRIIITDFATARREHAAHFAAAFTATLRDGDKYGQLARAFHSGGLFIDVPAGVAIDEPIDVSLAASGTDAFPYIVIHAGAGARVTFIERAHGSGIVCGLTEIVAAERAQVTYTVLQEYADDARTIMTRRAAIGADATVDWAFGELGAALCVEDVLSSEIGSGASSEMTALFFATGDQHVDLRTEVAHEVGSTRSNTVVRSVATDHGQARHFGNIRIAARAHGSDAALHDDTLLLSKTAHVDAIPALEIAANDVKAFHGATVGAVDEEHLFYIMSRGIDRRAAEQLVTLGFFEPAITRFPLDATREHLRTVLAAKVTAEAS